jgi:hypothetical protein
MGRLFGMSQLSEGRGGSLRPALAGIVDYARTGITRIPPDNVSGYLATRVGNASGGNVSRSLAQPR